MTPVADPPLTTPHESDRIDTDTAMAVPPNLPDSPRAMANAVLAEAHRTVQIRLSQQEATNHPDSPPNDSLVETRENATTSPETTIQHDSTMAGNKYRKRHRDLLDNDKGPDTDKGLSTLQQQAKARLASLWSANTNCNEGDNRSGSNNNDNVDRDEAIEQTKQLVLEQIEQLVRQGLQLYHRQENQARELARYQEENDYKERELKRLRQSEAQSRDTITKLLRTVETSRSDLKDSTRAVEAEARLRANLGKLREECNTLATAADETKRQQALLADELKFVKAKANRLTQEKNKIERDSRAAIALARSLDSGTNSDVDFYKRKVSDLTSQMQGQQTLLAEQKQQIEEMRRQIERNMSQNRLAKLRADTARYRRPQL